MAILDDEKLRGGLLRLIQVDTGLRPACKMIGISRTTLARYMTAHPEFAAEVEAARGFVPKRDPAPPPETRRPRPVDLVEVIDAEVIPLTAPVDPNAAGWSKSPAACLARAERFADATEEHPAIRAKALAYIWARALRDEVPATQVEQCIIEVVAKDPLPEAADG